MRVLSDKIESSDRHVTLSHIEIAGYGKLKKCSMSPFLWITTICIHEIVSSFNLIAMDAFE